ncbi:Bug family tripartite tricarboxylate transporter substrate binding protein [Alicycliphilus denitrificans]|uniref:Tripartite tricarboxylate transporter substrate binding protein n=1 Tax=Alicycliphilus denitrificans TaxID=179636 RepID=A0A3R7EWU0_9BURK|nr:tripartite tricarboxylate transporter substrate binding protein [Alicycliphilus denitrificans]RKJ93968.1 tripartite tricarboxylate transporter substrate binding protein [Alicycliphilus denitrificans]
MRKLFVTLLASLSSAAAVADFPEKPITFVVPYAAGGPADLIGRAVARQVSQLSGQPVIVENRAGAGGNIAGDYVARAPKDGYTLLFGSSPVLVMNPALYKNLKFDPLTDFQPIADFGSLPNAVLVSEGAGITSVSDLVAKGKTTPLSYASAGSGGTTHLSGVLFGQKTNAQMLHVPYKGSGPALQALLGNQVMATFTDIFTAKPFVDGGQLKMLAVTSDHRSLLFPSIPTLAEAGVKGVNIHVFFALLAPSGIPDAVKQKLSSLSQAALKSPELRKQLESRGLDIPSNNTPEELSHKMRRETQEWAVIIRASGASLD